jgi:hypothetical protein
MADGLHIPTQNRTMKLLAMLEVWWIGGWGGEMLGLIQPMYNITLFGIGRTNPPYTTNISQ